MMGYQYCAIEVHNPIDSLFDIEDVNENPIMYTLFYDSYLDEYFKRFGEYPSD